MPERAPTRLARHMKRCAHEVPSIPTLTAVFVTHAHWDHVGGHRYFRSLNPGLRFYGRSNYQEELSSRLDGQSGDAATVLRR